MSEAQNQPSGDGRGGGGNENGAGGEVERGVGAGLHRTRQTSLPMRQASTTRNLQAFFQPQDQDMMGSLIRRKRMMSVPIGGPGGSEFFGTPMSTMAPDQGDTGSRRFGKERSYPPGGGGGAPVSPGHRTSTRRNFSIDGLIARKQVSLDLQAAEQADFFHSPVLGEAEHLPSFKEEGEETLVAPASKEEDTAEVQLFRPLRFSRPAVPAKPSAPGAHAVRPSGVSTRSELGDGITPEIRSLIERHVDHTRELQVQISMLTDDLSSSEPNESEREKLLRDVQTTKNLLECSTTAIKNRLFGSQEPTIQEEGEEEEQGKDIKELADLVLEEEDDGIVKATRLDYYWTGLLLVIMLVTTGVVVGWSTHLEETYSSFGPVGLACSTPCNGSLESQDYFHGHSHFQHGEFIQLIVQLDPKPAHVNAIFEVVGHETGEIKTEIVIGPTSPEGPANFIKKVEVDFDHPHEDHIINVRSSDPDVVISYKLNASKLSHLAKHSEVIAALIMVFVYLLILLEIVHRTLVAIFGSLIALVFWFVIHEGESESIGTIMLHMEWSTLALLFGMMVIVGELSHTGVFERISVKLLMASNGSFNRLMVLLCILTAVASAFLDNVTTMLLVGPVTIDLCSIVGVDPRPYLIGEVLLSNVGGTATLIGDPPNIIIGSAFEEIGFVDFITDVLPCIFLFGIPVSIGVVLYIYRYYLTIKEMPDLDQDKLLRTYPIYDEPRLLIAGTVAFFVVLTFFLHPAHHKDTAWIALFGAFITMTFTNPHDVQDALRNHVEWDTLLFFAGLFVLVEVCAGLGLLSAIGIALSSYIDSQDEESQLPIAITLILWVSAFTSAFLDNIPYTATMIPVIRILAEELPETLPIKTLAWALSFGACLGGNGTLLGASANIVTAGVATNKGYEISFVNFFYPGMVVMIATVALANLYMLVVYVWI